MRGLLAGQPLALFTDPPPWSAPTRVAGANPNSAAGQFLVSPERPAVQGDDLDDLAHPDGGRGGQPRERGDGDKQPFLDTVAGARSKELLIRDEDVQVLHDFDRTAQARDYLFSELLTKDVVGGLSPLLQADPEIRIYETA